MDLFKELSPDYKVIRIADVLNVPRSFYYKHKKAPVSKRKQEDKVLGEKVKELFYKRKERYGSPRITEDLREEGIKCSKNRVSRLMKEQNLVAKAKKKHVVTTNSKHDNPVAPNLLNRQFKQEKPDTVYCSDLTYIWTKEGWLYLCVIIDLFSRRIVGWSMDKTMDSSMFVRALDMAYLKRTPISGLIFHSDRGSQFCSLVFRNALKNYGMQQSMSRKGNCWDNSVAESFFHTLKVEEVYGKTYETREEAKSCLFEYIEVFYNRQRRHSTLKLLSPVAFEEKYAEEMYEKAA